MEIKALTYETIRIFGKKKQNFKLNYNSISTIASIPLRIVFINPYIDARSLQLLSDICHFLYPRHRQQRSMSLLILMVLRFLTCLYRIYSSERHGSLLIFGTFEAALIRGRHSCMGGAF